LPQEVGVFAINRNHGQTRREVSPEELIVTLSCKPSQSRPIRPKL
jgi:hypothetical protein